ncbi:MAG: AmmeMemoRadiSam system protein B [Planctomycetota bacterium]
MTYLIMLALAALAACGTNPSDAPTSPAARGEGALTTSIAADARQDEGQATSPNRGVQESELRVVLKSKLAGTWYEADPERLRAELRGYLEAAAPRPTAGIHALIQPHAGYRYSGAVAAYGAKLLDGLSPSRVVVMGPSHHVFMQNSASLPAATHFATPLGEVPLDVDFMRALQHHPFFRSLPRAHDEEHSVQIQLPLLQMVLRPFKLVPIVVGQLDSETARAMADVLLGLIDADTIVVASSDFTHYGARFGYTPFRDGVEENLRKLDMGAFAKIEQRDAEGFASYVEETGATICGRDPIRVLLHMVGPDWKAELLKYDTSGRMTGDFANTVSYLSIAFSGTWPRSHAASRTQLSVEDRATLLRLARETLLHALQKGELPAPASLGISISHTLREPRGAFVTLKEDGVLRGCIGQVYPGPPLYQAVMQMAVNSALRDTRFTPVQLDEYPRLTFEISVLTVPSPIASRDEIVLGKHGIILTKGGRTALFLPQVAPEQGWNLEETLSHLAQKAGLPQQAWREGASFLVFEAEVFGDEAGTGKR